MAACKGGTDVPARDRGSDGEGVRLRSKQTGYHSRLPCVTLYCVSVRNGRPAVAARDGWSRVGRLPPSGRAADGWRQARPSLVYKYLRPCPSPFEHSSFLFPLLLLSCCPQRARTRSISPSSVPVHGQISLCPSPARPNFDYLYLLLLLLRLGQRCRPPTCSSRSSPRG